MERTITDLLEDTVETAKKAAHIIEYADSLMDELTSAVLGPEEEDDDGENTTP